MKQNVRKILKKSGSLMLAAAMIGTGAVTVVPQIAESGITADAASYKSGDFTGYETTGGLSVYYHGKSQNVSFPSKIQGIKVVEVSLDFSYAEQIKTVKIPETVTKVYTTYYSNNKTALSSVTVDSKNKYYSSEN